MCKYHEKTYSRFLTRIVSHHTSKAIFEHKLHNSRRPQKSKKTMIWCATLGWHHEITNLKYETFSITIHERSILILLSFKKMILCSLCSKIAWDVWFETIHIIKSKSFHGTYTNCLILGNSSVLLSLPAHPYGCRMHFGAVFDVASAWSKID